MGPDELIGIALVIVAGLAVSIAMRRVKEGVAEIESPFPPGETFALLKEELAREGLTLQAGDDSSRSITVPAKIKCFDMLLYRVWADRITITVVANDQTESRLVATARPAPLLLHVRQSNPQHMDTERFRDLLRQAIARPPQ